MLQRECCNSSGNLIRNLRSFYSGMLQQLRQRQRLQQTPLLRGARGPMTLLLGHLRQRRRRGVALPARTRPRGCSWHPKLCQAHQLRKGCRRMHHLRKGWRRMDHLRKGGRRMDHRRSPIAATADRLRRSLQQPGDRLRRRRRRCCREDGPPPPTQKTVSLLLGGALLRGQRPRRFHEKTYSAGSSGASRVAKLQQPQPPGVRPGPPA